MNLCGGDDEDDVDGLIALRMMVSIAAILAASRLIAYLQAEVCHGEATGRSHESVSHTGLKKGQYGNTAFSAW